MARSHALPLPVLLVSVALFACDGSARRSRTGGGGGGNNNPPNPPVCTARTCADAGAQCGQIDDGCGQTLDCGGCDMGLNCGGDGTPNVCGQGMCTPATCESLGATCGSVSDGCSAMLECGRCTAPDTCGGGGVANQCGQGCVPTTCAAEQKNCGAIPDGCGGTLQCGQCQGGLTCGGGGTANVCGEQMCQPTVTCASAGANCGQVDDGCNNLINCGQCQPGLTCGGGGTANVCGAMCAMSCPSGYTCNTLGICAGGDPTQFVLDVRTHRVGGVVTMNGGQPGSRCSSSDRATVTFREPNLGYTHSIAVPCNGGSSPFTFTGVVYPGTYDITVAGGLSDLPRQSFTVATGVVINADRSDFALDVRTHLVGGVVTMNGQRPGSTCSSSDRATVTFREPTLGYTHSIAVPCNGGSSPFTFSGSVYPGTYEVTVAGGLSDLPRQAFTVASGVVINTNQTNFMLDVRTHLVGGVVTMNGQQPGSRCSSSDRATVTFRDPMRGYTHSIPVPCNGGSSPFTFSGTVYPGTYDITVSGGLSDLPRQPFGVASGIVINADRTNFGLDVRTVMVDGVVTMNGSIPASSCSSSDRATVTFVDPTQGYTHAIAVPCDGGSSPFRFSGAIYPGTYNISVSGGLSDLPRQAFVVQTGVGISNNRTFALDVRTHMVGGLVTMNGQMPGSRCSSSDRATVTFFEPNLRYTHAIAVPCDGGSSPFRFMGVVYPGTYEIRVAGGLSDLPRESFTVATGVVINADSTNFGLDVVTHRVAGLVTMNGAMPGSSCSSSDRATVTFHDENLGYTHSFAVPCDGGASPFRFTGFVYPGVFDIRVSGGLSDLPRQSFTVYEDVQIP